MQLPSASRPTRVRRLLAVSAAAVAVMIAPTACDYGGYSGAPSSHDMGDMGDMPGMDHGAENPQQHVVVPVANTSEAAPATASERRRSRDGRRFWRNRYNNGRPPTTTTATPAPGDPTATETVVPTDPTVPPVTDPGVPATETVPPTTAPPTVPGQVGAALPPGGADGNNNGLTILGRDCTASDLDLHNGFQSAKLDGAGVAIPGSGVAQCVNTEMGEVAAEDSLPSLLIVDAPKSVGVKQAFTLKISTRNLVRDRFLGAGAGGYYLEASFLNGEGLQRGHFHTACRILDSTALAPNSGVAPAFFLATEDGGGGREPDVVTVSIPQDKITQAGTLQCTSWAGDGSHRTPMMTRANETPAIDSVRITVTNDNAPPSGYTLAEGNDPAAAQADAAEQAEVKQDQAAAQQPDVEVNGETDTDTGAGAAPEAPAAPAAPDTSEAPAETDAPADTATEAPAADAPADDN